MRKGELTPCGALFGIMKRYGEISNKELASMILSGRPLADGVSPISRINDRAWLSRFIVHAPVGTIQERYFANFSSSALRVAARLKSGDHKRLSNDEIMDLVVGKKGEAMRKALRACHQDLSLYENIGERLIHDSGYTKSERTEMSILLLIAAGCTANVRKAADEVISFSHTVHGAGMTSRLVTPDFVQEPSEGSRDLANAASSLALFRVEDGCLIGEPHWLSPEDGEIDVGSLSLADKSITDVQADVSSNHLRILYEEGQWYAQGLNSKHGTTLIDGANHAKMTIEPPRDDSQEDVERPKVPIHPGDELILGANTHFLIMAAKPHGLSAH